jgi:hypothetical protein
LSSTRSTVAEPAGRSSGAKGPVTSASSGVGSGVGIPRNRCGSLGTKTRRPLAKRNEPSACCGSWVCVGPVCPKAVPTIIRSRRSSATFSKRSWTTAMIPTPRRPSGASALTCDPATEGRIASSTSGTWGLPQTIGDKYLHLQGDATLNTSHLPLQIRAVLVLLLFWFLGFVPLLARTPPLSKHSRRATAHVGVLEVRTTKVSTLHAG